MKLTRTATAIALILACASGAVETASARGADTSIKQIYKKTNWARYQRQMVLASRSGQTGKVKLPDTDCPPLPTKECLKTWKIKTINPFE